MSVNIFNKSAGTLSQVAGNTTTVDTPISGSTAPLSSGGAYNALSNVYTKAQIDAIAEGLASGSDLAAHVGNSDIHVTTTEKATWNAKADASDLTTHTSDTTSHITAAERLAWNAKADASSVYTKSEMDTSLDTKADSSALTSHTSNTDIHVTTTDKATWNAKADASSVYTKSETNDLLDGKVNAQAGYGLSQENFTTELKTKLNSITNPIQIKGRVDTISDLPATETDGALYLVGLITDTDKYEYVFINNEWELLGKSTEADLSNYYTKTETDSALSNKASASTLQSHIDDSTIHITSAERSTWNAKADASDLTTHTSDTTSHITAAERSSWNAKADSSSVYTKSEMDTSLGTKADSSALTSHTSNTDIHVTTTDKASWNAKADASSVYTKGEVDTALAGKSDTTHNHDSAYAAKINEHTHSNKTVIDKFSEDAGGNVLYNGQSIAGTGTWTGITGKPFESLDSGSFAVNGSNVLSVVRDIWVGTTAEWNALDKTNLPDELKVILIDD